MSEFKEHIQEMDLSDVMGERFGRYSKYIIQDRAIPDIRDGLKPVQRRILYAMYNDGNRFDKGYRKSAKAVGNVIGHYHPHGDSSVYEAMVRMSQEWKMREQLIDMQGNNGSMDGDPPAAMRYTEARLSKIAEQLTADLDKDTVDWVLNFDDTEYEPTLMPARFPNLLVNGTTGISAGYATDIPPHNLGEVIDACLYLLKHPNAGLDKLMTFVKGPDFPTGGIIQGLDDVKKAYKTGQGRIVVRSRSEIETLRGGRQQIVITEVPYETNKASIIRQLDDIRLNKEIEGINDVRDETDREGLRIAIELKKDANAEGILTYLLKETDLQVNYNFNMVAINNKRPEQLGLKTILDAYLDHRRDVVTRRTRFDLKKAEKRQHIVQGLIKAVSILDEVIEIIRQSKNKADAKQSLEKAYEFTEVQSEAIVTLQLYRLSNTDITQLQKEEEGLAEQITSFREILEDENNLNKVIADELKETKKDFSSQRRTSLEAEIEDLKVDKEVLIAEEDVIVVVTKEGYLKRTSLRSYAASKPEEVGIREHDYPLFVQEMTTLQQIILFTSKGNAINRPVHSLSDIRWKDQGEHISQSITLEDGEEIIAVFGLDEFTDDYVFVLATRNGSIKQTLASQFEPRRTYKSTSYTAIGLKSSDDALIHVDYVKKEAELDVFAVTKRGYGLRYSLDEVSIVGSNAKGVISMNLKDGDVMVGTMVFDPTQANQDAIFVTQRGSVKKMNLVDFDLISRAKRGLLVLRELKANPHRMALFVPIGDENRLVTLISSMDKEVTFESNEWQAADRQNNGSFVFEENVDGSPVAYHYNEIQHFLNVKDSETPE